MRGIALVDIEAIKDSEVRFDWRDQGLACEIVLPLA